MELGGIMDSFTFFDIYDYTILAVILLLSIYLLFFLIKKTRTEISLNKAQNLLKLIKINISIGLSLFIMSLLLFIYVETSHEQILEFLKPVSIMTSEPYVVLSFALFCFGVVMIIIGTYRITLFKKTNRIS